ncbi:MAG: restriction endonuclease subunit S [Bacteroides sp.]|nr:restriction endonuclease subunit S [Bacteroides sp.]
MRIPLPPLSEQKKIAAYLEEVDKETNRLIELNHRAIDKLKEYKQVLIDQAVRGEICLV